MKDSKEPSGAESEVALKSYQWHCLVGGLAHELNNKIAPVLGFTSLLAANADGMTHEKRLATLEAIQSSAEEASRIVRTLLQLSNRPASHEEPFDLGVIARESLDFVRSEIVARKGFFTDRSMENTDPVMVMADPDQVRQVIINLLLHLSEAAEREGEETRSWYFQVTAAGDSAVLALENLGAPGEELARPFEGPDPESAEGLGVCQKLIERIGGSIETARESGVELAIRLKLPLMRTSALSYSQDEIFSAADEESPRGKDSAGKLEKFKVLVVDDEPFIVQILSLGIEDELGCEVTTAENGRIAIEKLKEGSFDLVVSDVRMPDGDGFDLFAWVVKNHDSLASRFLFITGDTGGIMMDQRLSEVPAPVLRKPFVIEEISRECRRLLTPHGRN